MPTALVTRPDSDRGPPAPAGVFKGADHFS